MISGHVLTDCLCLQVLQATLLDFATVEKWNRHVDLRNDTNLEPHCVVKGYSCKPVPNGSAACDKTCMAINTIPASERAPTDYQWQRNPMELVSGNDDTAHEVRTQVICRPL